MKKILLLSLVFISAACSKSVEISGNPYIPPMNQPAPVQIGSADANRKISGPLVSGGNVSDSFKATPDGSKIVYVADESIDTVNDLYVTNIPAGDGHMNLTNLALGKKVSQFLISPDGTKVAFLADIATTGLSDLYIINLDKTGLHHLNIGLSNSSQKVETNFRFNNAGNKVVYATDEESTGVRNIYSVNLDGTNRLRLNQTAGTQLTFALAKNDSRVVYRTFSANPVLRSVTLSATGDVLLNTPFDTNLNSAAGVQDFKISNNENNLKVLYRANQDNGSTYELYLTKIDGTGVVTKVSAPMVSQGIVSPNYDISPNDSKIVYIADQQTDEVQEIFSVNTDGSSNTKINPTLVSNGDVVSFKISSDSQKVVYLADEVTDGVNELFSVNMTGSSNTKINSNLIAGEEVANQYLLLGSQIVYSTDKSQSGYYSVFSNLLTGSNEVRLSKSISTGVGFFDQSNLTSQQFSSLADNSRIILLGSDVTSNKNLYSVKLDGSSGAQLNNLITGSGVQSSASSLGSTFLTVGNYVIYRYNNGVATELYITLARN